MTTLLCLFFDLEKETGAGGYAEFSRWDPILKNRERSAWTSAPWKMKENTRMTDRVVCHYKELIRGKNKFYAYAGKNMRTFANVWQVTGFLHCHNSPFNPFFFSYIFFY